MFNEKSLSPQEKEFRLKIETQAKEFFSISKDDENYTTKLDTAKTKLVINIWKYCKKFHAEKDKSGFSQTDKYSLEIFETIESCIKSFNNSKGNSFLALFEFSVKRRIAESEKKENLRGLKLPVKETKDLKILEKIVRNIYDKEKVFDAGRKKLGWSDERIQNAFDLVKIKTIDQIKINYEGEESSNFDSAIMEEYHKQESKEKEEIKTQDFFEKVESEFKKQQERTKEYLPALLTYHYADDLLKLEAEEIKKFSFVDIHLLEEICENPKLGQKDVAKRIGKSEQYVSGRIKKFLEKLK